MDQISKLVAAWLELGVVRNTYCSRGGEPKGRVFERTQAFLYGQ